ncbi:alpha-1,4 polygalactosaminidase [Hymenobacter sp. BT635]|uniref:Alpha-1,4 polygalactosaminidase n=1 Tax=Hymenobacter nitidus TaxID=2880929 RepID=A0ABS8AJG9_9BACT|nr:Z1 domain-containing protein [Hymenobacter nitidus]MCB2380440.1 alpha-1,4 polygalactosaminidase [Hymenobacter nitidus]
MSSITTPTAWSVKLGQQVDRLKDHLRLPAPAAEKLMADTKELMGLCGSPYEETSAETGLALGFVQSGKTMSFTSLIAMARDNDYQVIIVVAGVSNVLVAQSVDRLTKDLQLNGANSREWRIVKNPTLANGLEDIRATLQEYKTDLLPRSLQRTVVIAVMKNKKRLESLIQVVEKLQHEFKGVPTLIVDDEADQAGMNTQAKPNRKRVASGLDKKLSAVHAQLLSLKAALPHHTFVQYTATPQAPLFIERQDELSPNFIKLLTPGAGYTGGERFFSSSSDSRLVKVIPAAQIHSDDNPLSGPPAMLAEAMRVFFLGVAERYAANTSENNRSMMVHPSQLTNIHQLYFSWVMGLKDTWTKLLAKPEGNTDRQALVVSFQQTYAQLYTINPAIASFEQHLKMLPYAISSTQIRLLNAAPGSAPQIDWNSHYSFILVGGQAMDRGFTVEGLTVTYMPRGLGTGTADTLQQRARFFGYKEKYLHLCRIYLTSDVKEAFTDYVTHETDLRLRLQPYDAGRMLNDFERCVALPSSLAQLTRPAVMSDDIERYSFGGRWIQTRAVLGSAAELSANKAAIEQFVHDQEPKWQVDKGHADRTTDQKHQVAQAPLMELVDLLRSYIYLSTDDSSTFAMLANSLETYSKANASAEGVVYRMSGGKKRARAAVNGKVRQLFQGRNPKKGAGELIYPGDIEIRELEQFSLQIHSLEVKNDSGPRVFSFALAVWVPASAGVEMVKLAGE